MSLRLRRSGFMHEYFQRQGEEESELVGAISELIPPTLEAENGS